MRRSVASKAADLFRNGYSVDTVRDRTGLSMDVLTKIQRDVWRELRRDGRIDDGPEF